MAEITLLKRRRNYQNTRCNFIIVLFLFLLIVPTELSGQEAINLIQSTQQDTVRQSLLTPDQITGENQFIVSIEEYVRLNQTPPAEKIYLHLDRPNYMQGDTIWFKAYSWYGYDQVPDTLSGVLYVDLLNPEGRIKLKRKVLIENGASNGDFCLDTTISPGNYTIRAYTRWMQNMNTGEPFYQTITISPVNQNFQVECNPVIIKQAGTDSLKISFRFFELDQRGDLKNSINHNVNYSLEIGDQTLSSGQVLAANTNEQTFKCSLSTIDKNKTEAVFELSIQDDRLTFKKQFRFPVNENIDLQFFPEGGKLVNGLESKIAFKAIGTYGLGREVKGVIEDEAGDTITNFESSHKGMGVFLLKPQAKNEYFAHIWYNNAKYVIPLPPASYEGSVMKVSFAGNGNDPYLTIKQSPSEENTRKYVVGSTYGKIWFSAFVKITKDSCRLKIPLELLPEGVCRITVLDKDFKPECERLIYVDKNQRFKIEVIPDSSSYGTRSKVSLLIKTTGAEGVPVQTDLSLAVVDKEQIRNESGTSGIFTYKLLESELKGNIEDVGYNFKDDSCTSHDALELLLLTQGYRKFLPDTTNFKKQKFQPEKSFDISGKIKFGGSKSREKKFNYRDIGLTLLCQSEKIYIDQSKPDSLGQFSFHIPLLYGKPRALLQSTNSKGKAFYGDFFLDETVAIPKFTFPIASVYNSTSPAIEYIRQLQAVKKTEISKNPAYGAMSLNLPEVTVTAKAKNWYLDFEKEAKKIANLDSLDPIGNKYGNIYDLLIREFGAKKIIIPKLNLETIFLPCIKTLESGDEWFPIYVINGKTYWNGEGMYLYPLNTLSTLRVSEIKKVMVLPPMNNIVAHYTSFDIIYKYHLYQSLVVIETYSDNKFYRGDPLGIKTFILEGLDTPRMFYSPGYDGPSRKNPIYDGRATLFWGPSIRTDSIGQAKVDFFTSDRHTNLEVTVNGIEVGNGNPGQRKILINSAKKK